MDGDGLLMDASNRPQRSGGGTIPPMALWRWGFSILLAGVGIWLLLSDTLFGGREGRILGWIVIGYAVVRLGFYWLSDSWRERR